MVLSAQGIVDSLALVRGTAKEVSARVDNLAVRERSQQIHGSNGAERDLVYHIMRKQGSRRLTMLSGIILPLGTPYMQHTKSCQNSETATPHLCRSVDMHDRKWIRA